MLFHITYKVPFGQRDAAQERFKKTGAPPTEGVTMKDRWHSVDGDRGFIIAETSNVEAIGKWIQDWSDVLNFKATPILTDEQIAKVIS